MPGPVGADLFKYFTETDPYQQWDLFPVDSYPASLRTDYIRPGTHRFFNGMIARTYINSIGAQALATGERTMPPGTIIVVERWVPEKGGSIGPEDSPDNHVVMYKIKDFDPENGDWFYLTVKGGEIGDEGKVAGCQSCHAKVQDNDFIYISSGKLPLLAPEEAPAVNDKGEALLKMLTKDFHYTHYELIPDENIPDNIPRSTDLAEGIEWFNGILRARLFANPIAMDVIKSGGTEYPDGSLLVAEQYKTTEDGAVLDQPFAVVAQIKVKGADRKHNDWVWFSYDLQEEKILTFGKDAKFCYDCHTQVKKNDFVWTTSGKDPKK